MTRIYLAGPDVFHPDALNLGAAKKALCRDYGLVGVFPLDKQAALDGLSATEQGLAIADKDLGLLRSCDIALVNLTPYPQLTMDPGSAVELGMMAGLGRLVWGYTTTAEAVETRLAPVHPEGWLAERFGLVDNLMIEGTIRQSGGQVIRPETTLPFEDLSCFEACLKALAAHLAT
ncbi:nucleoside 2-deoxyribosyltransferase [Phaeobacter sp. HF9A]|uniref:nucleoside 2-deoxyribosyltransferase n=1 Tax=Phaeobacter sp. HF9A TaxID=2721561 RepID=UPI0014313AC4|nr:nucleoside 2-deoxyribosyltransferase [Phaeobacter sp. HF9A]NIZ15424.1 nucleoside 2-deoxyribosyltransferase [Phaeobacter sp. HF9A]